MGMLSRIRWVCVLLGMTLGSPASAEPRPFELRGGQVVITVTLQGREVPALLDTGATVSLIEVGLARELGIRSQEIWNAGTIGASGKRVRFGHTSRPVKVDVGAGVVTRRIGTYPTGNTFADDGVRLLIGMDFLDAMVLSLDFQTMTMDVQRSSTFKAPEGGEPLAMTRNGWRRHILPVDLGGARAELLLDTAASGALHLDSAFVAQTSPLKALPVSSRRIAGIDGIHDHDAIVVPSVGLGGEVFDNVQASSGPLASLRAADDMDGVVGVDLLKRFNLVIDFGRQRIWMTPNANRDAPFRWNRIGR
jgi:gag-polyprotein putative aspartyl protease